ncbi:hypothetical protein KY284_019313 [Solanum tuberosum]|nr:hypothetical protein KY284_019313 [Solanum tuberosum]
MGKPFAEAIKIGEMVENDIKSSKIVSQTTIRATTQAIQSGSGNFVNRKKEEGSMMTSGSREQGRKENFTPIGESYTSLLRKLVQLRLVEPINPYFVNLNARGFDPTVICEYYANTPSHSIENCCTLKRVIEKLIEDKVIEIRNEEAPNVTNNPLPAHNKEHVVGMIDIYEDCEQTYRTKMESRDSKEESSMVLEPIQKATIIVNGASSNFGDSRKLVLYVPGAVKRREVPLNGPNLYIPCKLRTFGQNQESVKEPVVIQIKLQHNFR